MSELFGRYEEVPLDDNDQGGVPQDANLGPSASPPYGLTPTLRPELVAGLQKMGVNVLFNVQRAVMPLLLDEDTDWGDVCVAAPTGRGKTLCYAVPILQKLASQRSIGTLRCIVLVPTRELANQVFGTFTDLIHSAYLHFKHSLKGVAAVKVVLASGAQPFAAEMRLFHNARLTDGDLRNTVLDLRSVPADCPNVVVATPGRLVDHFAAAERGGFAATRFGGVRHVVIDEADRLLGRPFHGWLDVMRRLGRMPGSDSSWGGGNGGLGPTWDIDAHKLVRTKKLLFSATFAADSAHLAALSLERPLFIRCGDAGQGFAVPREMRQFAVACPPEEKPAALLQLLYQALLNARARKKVHSGSDDGDDDNDESSQLKTVVFCSKKSTGHRLARLLQALFHRPSDREPHPKRVACDHEVWNGLPRPSVVKTIEGSPLSQKVAEISADLPQRQREGVLEKFKQGEVSLLLASDVLARGVDVADVDFVINYDPPRLIEGYIHRAGRTARAGRLGTTFTLVEDQQVCSFNQMLRSFAKHAPGATSSLADLVRPYPLPGLFRQELMALFKELRPLMDAVLHAEASGASDPFAEWAPPLMDAEEASGASDPFAECPPSTGSLNFSID